MTKEINTNIYPKATISEADAKEYSRLVIREADATDRPSLDQMQMELQQYFAEIDSTHESLAYQNLAAAHQYMQKMLDDVDNMQGKILVAEKDGEIIGFVQGVIIEHNKGDDKIYDLSHLPGKEGWIGLLYVKPEYRGHKIGQKLLDKIKDYFTNSRCTSIRLLVLADNTNAIKVYQKNGFIPHDIEMILKLND